MKRPSSSPEPNPTPLQVEQSRLIEEAICAAFKQFLDAGIAPAIIGSGGATALARFTLDHAGPAAAVRLFREHASIIETVSGPPPTQTH